MQAKPNFISLAITPSQVNRTTAWSVNFSSSHFHPWLYSGKVLPEMLKAQQNASRDNKQMPEFF